MNTIKTLFISTFVLSMSCLQGATTAPVETNNKQVPASKSTTAPTYNAVEANRVNKPTAIQSVDREIEKKIQNALKASKTLSNEAKSVNIVAASGIVSITGKVQSEAEKAQIEKVAKEIDGVKSVGLSLTINPAVNKAGEKTGEKVASATDEDIQKQVRWDLQHNFSLSPDAKALTVTVNDGKITLSGNVTNEIEKAKVESLAKIVHGAKTVTNNTTVKK